MNTQRDEQLSDLGQATHQLAKQTLGLTIDLVEIATGAVAGVRLFVRDWWSGIGEQKEDPKP